MSVATDRIDDLIDSYLAGKQRFMGFWTAFMEVWANSDLSDSEEHAYSEAYDAVYMGGDGPVAPRDSAVGVLSESEVKARLRTFRKGRSGASPA